MRPGQSLMRWMTAPGCRGERHSRQESSMLCVCVCVCVCVCACACVCGGRGWLQQRQVEEATTFISVAGRWSRHRVGGLESGVKTETSITKGKPSFPSIGSLSATLYNLMERSHVPEYIFHKQSVGHPCGRILLSTKEETLLVYTTCLNLVWIMLTSQVEVSQLWQPSEMNRLINSQYILFKDMYSFRVRTFKMSNHFGEIYLSAICINAV